MPQKMIDNIHWLGHDSFYAQGSKVVYFDPWDVSGEPKADLILISHEHFDHLSPDDVAKLTQPGTVIITEADSAAKLSASSEPVEGLSGDVRVVKPGDELTVQGVKVKAVPSYNTDKDFHPKTNHWLGFLVELDGVKIYHTGDSDFIPEMKSLDVDIALLPVSGTYVMNQQQAVEAAKAIKPKIAVPMHYGKIVGSEDDAVKFKQALAGQVEVVIKKKE